MRRNAAVASSGARFSLVLAQTRIFEKVVEEQEDFLLVEKLVVVDEIDLHTRRETEVPSSPRGEGRLRLDLWPQQRRSLIAQ